MSNRFILTSPSFDSFVIPDVKNPIVVYINDVFLKNGIE